MKIEMGSEKPDFLQETWPGQYDFFSHFEFLCGIPHTLFLITTLKENGRPYQQLTVPVLSMLREYSCVFVFLRFFLLGLFQLCCFFHRVS